MTELDEITIQRAVKGQKAAFKSLYDWYAPFIWRVVLKMTGNEETARELVQESFVKVHSSLTKFRGDASLSTWIYRITYNVVMQHLSSVIKMRSHDPYEDTIQGEYRADNYENQQIVERIMRQLSADEKFLLVAREVDDIDFEELATITGESSGSLRTRLSRLKERIRESFTKEVTLKEAV